MICTKCGCECSGFATGNPVEDICSDCAFPALARASKAAAKAVVDDHFARTGEKKSFGEIFFESFDSPPEGFGKY